MERVGSAVKLRGTRKVRTNSTIAKIGKTVGISKPEKLKPKSAAMGIRG